MASIAPNNASLSSIHAITTDIVLLDSGSSHHRFNDAKWFVSLGPLAVPITSKNADGGVTTQHQGGVVTITTKGFNGGTVSLTVSDAIYSPNAPINLLSVGAMSRKGYNLNLREKVVQAGIGDVQFPFELYRDVLILPAALPGNSGQESLAMASVDYEVMHRRLLHASSRVVKQVVASAGIHVSGAEGHCAECYIAKSTDVMSRRLEDPVMAPGQLVGIDLVTCRAGFKGYRYFLHFIDSYSSRHWVQITAKHEAYECLKRFVALFERQTALKLQTLGLDGGSEFDQATRPWIQSKLTEWCRDLGITLKTTTPHTPSLNGRAERAGRTIIEKARAIMGDAHIPEHLWPLAVDTSAKVTNLLPTRANPGQQSPHERLLLALGLPEDQAKPYIDHLRVYGCKAYVHLKPAYRDNADKFSHRATVGQLVGYIGTHGRICHVWFRETDRIVTVSGVRFHESIPNDTPKADDGEVHGEVTFDEHLIQVFYNIAKTVRAPVKLAPVTECTKAAPDFMIPDDTPQDGDAGWHTPPQQLLSPEATPPQTQQHHEQPAYIGIRYNEDGTIHVPQLFPETEDEEVTPELSRAPSRAPGAAPETTDKELTAPLPGPPVNESPDISPEEQLQAEEPPPLAPLHRPARRTTRRNYSQLHKHGLPEPSLSNMSIEQWYFAMASIDCHDVDNLREETWETAICMSAIDAVDLQHAGPTVPKNYHEAHRFTDYKQRWLPAMQKQLQSLEDMHAWDLVPAPRSVDVLPGRWVYSEKAGDARARWVVWGNRERDSWAAADVFAAVASSTTLKVFLAHVAVHDLHMQQYDFKTAFLNADVPADETIYVQQPHGLQQDKSLVCRLRRALYGLTRSPRWWFDTLTPFMRTLGFTVCNSDICLFRNDSTGVIMLIYVDDILMAGPLDAQLTALGKTLGAQYPIWLLGEATSFLGLDIRRDRSSRRITCWFASASSRRQKHTRRGLLASSCQTSGLLISTTSIPSLKPQAVRTTSPRIYDVTPRSRAIRCQVAVEAHRRSTGTS